MVELMVKTNLRDQLFCSN